MTNVYRHKNGGGLKVFPAQASPDSFVDEHSTVEGETRVYLSSLFDSALKDSFVSGSRLRGALADGCNLADALVVNSELVRCDVTGGALVSDSRLSDCRVHSCAGQSPHVERVRLSGATVYGDAYLVGSWGLELEGAHIHAGLWNEPPRHLAVEGGGIHVAVLECTEGRAHMGCRCDTVNRWLDRGPKLGRRLGWNEEQIEECLTFLKTLSA